MIPALDLIIRCPRNGCSAHYRVRQYASGNTFGARVWTDGRMIAPMWPKELPWGMTPRRWKNTTYVRFLTPREPPMPP